MTANSDNQERLTTTKQHQVAESPASDPAGDYYNRAIASLKRSEWDKACADLSAAVERGLDVAATFIETYKSAGDFEDSFDVELPGDIADIVDPISEEEDAALARLTEEGLDSELVSEECVMAILRGEDGG